METEKSIHTLLLEAGYSHHRRSTEDGRHAITEIATGTIVGHMHAHEAVEFLHSLNAKEDR